MKILVLLAFIIFLAFEGKSQYILLGDADYIENGCIKLTNDRPYSEGIAYHSSKLNLESYFQIEFDIYLGDKDEYGADGITFVIHNDPREFQAFGTYGECMGYGRWNVNYLAGNYIAPSIAIEFDTYFNPSQNDPTGDHVAYLENGTNFHTAFWNNNNEAFNLEDDRLHSFRLVWDPTQLLLEVYLDQYKVYEGKKDLINQIFKGNTSVIWGFTASTGRKYNLQYFCLKRIAVRQLNGIQKLALNQSR